MRVSDDPRVLLHWAGVHFPLFLRLSRNILREVGAYLAPLLGLAWLTPTTVSYFGFPQRTMLPPVSLSQPVRVQDASWAVIDSDRLVLCVASEEAALMCGRQPTKCIAMGKCRDSLIWTLVMCMVGGEEQCMSLGVATSEALRKANASVYLSRSSQSRNGWRIWQCKGQASHLLHGGSPFIYVEASTQRDLLKCSMVIACVCLPVVSLEMGELRVLWLIISWLCLLEITCYLSMPVGATTPVITSQEHEEAIIRACTSPVMYKGAITMIYEGQIYKYSAENGQLVQF